MTATPEFNLIDEPWLPCLRAGARTPDLLSIRETFASAHECIELAGETPLVTAALHRLLLAVLHRAVGPPDVEAWQALYARGRFDDPRIAAYLERWQARFDLFDQRYPFYQCPAIGASRPGSAAKLWPALSSGNNPSLFDHTADDDGSSFPPDAVARAIVAAQSFALGGTVARLKGEGPSAPAAPLANSVVFLVSGSTLFQTLMLNLVRYAPERGYPFAAGAGSVDAPGWERAPATDIAERAPTGYTDLLTWQSRRVRAYPEDKDGIVRVSRTVIMKGDAFPDGFRLHGKEPMLAFRRVQSRDAADPWPALAFSEGRALWRDSSVIFQDSAKAGDQARPATLAWLAAVGVPVAEIQLHGLGLASDRAKAEFWRHERLPLPHQFVEHPEDLYEPLSAALSLAEDAGSLLSARGPLREIATALIGAGGDAHQFLKALGADRLYWAALDEPFLRFLARLPEDLTHYDDAGAEYGVGELRLWAAALRHAAREAFRIATGALQTSGRTLQAVARSEDAFERRLAGLVRPYLKEEVSV